MGTLGLPNPEGFPHRYSNPDPAVSSGSLSFDSYLQLLEPLILARLYYVPVDDKPKRTFYLYILSKSLYINIHFNKINDGKTNQFNIERFCFR